VCERYGRVEATEDQVAEGDVCEAIPEGPVGASGSGAGNPDEEQAMADESRRNLRKAVAVASAAGTRGLAPFLARVQKIVEMPNDAHYLAAVRGLRHELPVIAARAERTEATANALLGIYESVNHPWHNGHNNGHNNGD